MKYLIIIFLWISTCAIASSDTIVEQGENVKTTTIIIESDTLIHTDSMDYIVHEIVIEKIIEKTNDIIDAYKKKDYGRLVSTLLMVGFVIYSIYLRRKTKKCKENDSEPKK